MPRQARLDAPETLHHVMVRGIERTAIFRDETDRADFLARLAALAEQGAWTVYAWALLPNHAHLLVQTGGRLIAFIEQPEIIEKILTHLGLWPMRVYSPPIAGHPLLWPLQRVVAA